MTDFGFGAPPPGTTNNLAELENLDEPTLLNELSVRYRKDEIYTFVGDILCAINPYKWIDSLYDATCAKLHGVASDANATHPHVWSVAAVALDAMKRDNKNQCVVISGESGAGKTESAKQFLRHTIFLTSGTAMTDLEKGIIAVNPLLEAFGNAATNMNDNSSRFGKYLDLVFDANHHIIGAVMEQYLLEKSRSVIQGLGEQNFHIFYLMLSGLEQKTKEHLCITNPGDFKNIYENGDALAKIGSKTMLEEWKEVNKCILTVGFEVEHQINLWQICAAIMHLCNLEFKEDRSGHAAEIINEEALNVPADLLGLDYEPFSLSMTTRTQVVAGEEVVKAYRVNEAEDVRDATAKALYAKIFDWIVNSCNAMLSPKVPITEQNRKVGILDIFGFENFEINSFEQMCINLANEQLQFFFNEHIFSMELREYASEGINAANITYEDNQDTLDMILGTKPKMGLFALLDEQSFFPDASDKATIERFHMHKNNKRYLRPKGDAASFGIVHYAAEVWYEGEDFVEKNRDTLAADVQAALRLSDNVLCKLLFEISDEDVKQTRAARKGRNKAGRDAKAGRSRLRASMRKYKPSMGATATTARSKKMTVASNFKASLSKLVNQLNSAAPHFVRTIKPNHSKSPGTFEDDLVLNQLRYCGMLETTRIRREGYSMRPTFEEFVHRYQILGFYLSERVTPSASACRQILNKASIESSWQVGKTKVFMRYFHIEQLNERIAPIEAQVVKMQKMARGFIARRRFRRMWERYQKEKKQAKEFAQSCERALNGFHRCAEDLVEQDSKRPKDFFLPKKPRAAAGAGASSRRKIERSAQSSGAGNKFQRAKSVKWFKEKEMAKGAALTQNGAFADWFRGIITRREAEALLKTKSEGTFLVRVSESRFGYSLSVKWANRIKHFMIDQTQDEQYLVVGNRRTFPGLNELVFFHSTHPITDEKDLLQTPVGNDDASDVLDELLL